MVIVGDWNIRDPSWDDGAPTPNLQTRETLEWLHGSSFKLMNDPNVRTREDCNGHALVIDLVFTNESATESDTLSNIYINTAIGCLSDHHALTFSLGPPLDETPISTNKGLNWKHADEKMFCDALKAKIDLNHIEHTNLVRDLLNPDRKYASESELDGAVKIIQSFLEQAAEKTVPVRRLVS